MRKARQEQVPGRQKRMIVPASAQRPDGADGMELTGYALHTGQARSTEDVTVRNGTAPIHARGEGVEDDDEAEPLDDVLLASGGAPD